jgi:hypothetical protein
MMLFKLTFVIFIISRRDQQMRRKKENKKRQQKQQQEEQEDVEEEGSFRQPAEFGLHIPSYSQAGSSTHKAPDF